jgi:predicted nucleic acid-binding protein
MKLALDTNVIIDFLKGKTGSIDLLTLIVEHECFVSVIARLELLKYPDITPEEEVLILAFLEFVPILPLTVDIDRETIAISRASKLKLPDAIIAATAIVYRAEVVTQDAHFLACTYPMLRLWQTI